MSKQQRGEHETQRDEGGPGSSHQGGSHGRAHSERDKHAPAPGTPTNDDRSRIGGGGGERDIHHSHDPAHKS
jgi:hypothetical protein